MSKRWPIAVSAPTPPDPNPITCRPGHARAEPQVYRVSGLPPGEPLSVRAEPDPSAEQVGEIRTRALVFGCTNDTPSRTTWCRVKAGRALGWARRRYLAPE